MDPIPHPSPSLIQELQTDSRKVSLEVFSNHRIPKSKKCLVISMRNYLSVSFGGIRLCSHSVIQLRLNRDQKSSTAEKIICHSRSGISGGI